MATTTAFILNISFSTKIYLLRPKKHTNSTKQSNKTHSKWKTPRKIRACPSAHAQSALRKRHEKRARGKRVAVNQRGPPPRAPAPPPPGVRPPRPHVRKHNGRDAPARHSSRRGSRAAICAGATVKREQCCRTHDTTVYAFRFLCCARCYRGRLSLWIVIRWGWFLLGNFLFCSIFVWLFCVGRV